jgi:hypothetical protein
MKRFSASLPLGEGHTKHKVRLESDPAPIHTPMHRFVQFMMLREISENPELTSCGLNSFQRLSMYYNGERWIVEVEAEEEKQGA